MNVKQIDITVKSLPFAEERHVPGEGGDSELLHLHRYLFACQLVAGKDVLDIASGEGYGSAMLARTAHRVIGVDIAPEAISHAQAKYHADNLEFRCGSCSAIPLADASVDVVVSFETIEHHDEHEAMLREIKRVLRPHGVLVISTPDRSENSDRLGPINPYHVKELYRAEFKELLGRYFKYQSIFGQRVVYGSVIFCEDRPSLQKSYKCTDDELKPVYGVPGGVNFYMIAVASDSDLPLLECGLMEQPVADLVICRSLADCSYRFVRRAVSDSARWIWRNLPLSAQKKQRLKSTLFRRLPFVFGWTHAYRCWKNSMRAKGEM